MNATFQIVASLTGQRNVIPVPVVYVRVFGSYEAAVMLSQLTYWHEKIAPGRDGWQYRTEKDWEEEAALGRRGVESGRKALVAAGVIEYKLMGVPAKGHYRVLPEKLISVLVDRSTGNPDCGNRTNLFGGNEQSSLYDSAKLLQEPTPEPTPEPTSSLFAQVQERQDKKPSEERKVAPGKRAKKEAKVKAKTDLERLEELLGDAAPFARKLVTGYGSSAATILRRFDSTPSLLADFISLTENDFLTLLESAKNNAKLFRVGWQKNVGAQFFDLLGKRGAMHNSGNNTVASGLVDQDEEFPNPFDFHSLRHMDGLSEMKRAGNFVDTRRYYYRLKESGENPEREAEMKARLERDIAMYGPQSKQAGHDAARESNESISEQQE